MFSKLYEEIKTKISENYKLIISFFILLALLTFEFPYYINCPGGLININERVKIENANKITGSFNLTYVSELKATIPTLLIAKFNKNFDIVKKEDVVYENETIELMDFREHLLLKEANDNAIIYAYQKAKKDITINNQKIYVTYIDKNAKTDLKIKDEIIKIDDTIITSKEELLKAIDSYDIDEKIKFTVRRDDNLEECFAYLQDMEGEKKVGLIATEDKDIETNPKLELKFKDSESGPSGGFMMSLAIYSYLTKDITHNLKIAGTGTIDALGNVGPIGGIAYKIKGAVKAKADIFFAPSGENYEEAIKVKNENKYDIDIVEVKTFDDAINYLNNIS